ncbi:MAG: hypothetical protein AAF126_10960 [Chloroflexota bacterium]
MKAFSLDAWQTVADYVLAPIVAEGMVDNSARHFWRLNEQGMLSIHFPPGQWRDVYLAVNGLILADKPVHITTLQEALSNQMLDDYIAQLYAMYKKGSTLTGHVFDANVCTVKEYGERHKTQQRLQEAINELVQGGDDLSHDAIVANAISSLVNTGADTIENETAEGMSYDFENWLSEKPDRNLITGIDVVDDWTRGLGAGDFIAIAAPMKQRKTSLVLNMLISMARSGRSVALMMLESNKRMVNGMLVSIFAQEWILANNLYTKMDYDSNGQTTGKAQTINAKLLTQLRGNYPQLGEIRTQAIQHGIRELRALSGRLRVYDRTRNGGSLSDCASIHRVCLRDKTLYDTDFIAIDHAQRINERGSDYEKLTTVVPYLETLARRENIAMCLLAQMNASTAEGTGNTHLAGVRGGSVLDEAVDYMFITGYKQKISGSEERRPASELIVGLQHSRYGDGGAHKRAVVEIDPWTGLILKGGRGRMLKMEEIT